jgi:hypothetical protein
MIPYRPRPGAAEELQGCDARRGDRELRRRHGRARAEGRPPRLRWLHGAHTHGQTR